MGFVKNKMIELNEKGISHIIDKHVCSAHFEDEALVDFIHRYAGEGETEICGYCRKLKEQEGQAIPLVDLVSFINDGLSYFYGHPDNEGVAFESSEGGYIGVEILETAQLVDQSIYWQDYQTDLLNDITSSLGYDFWCIKDPYGSKENEKLSFIWEGFKEQILHKTRFFFFSPDLSPNESHTDLQTVLNHVSSRLLDFNPIKTLDAPSTFYRVRTHLRKNIVSDLHDIGAPPDKFACNSRMSPAGISALYCAFDLDTSIAETLYHAPSGHDVYTIGGLTTKNSLQILDLSIIQDMDLPSIFDPDNRKDYYIILFLKSFLQELTKDIVVDGRQHIEYIPTQVVTEYFRYIFPELTEIRLDGIVYPSSKQVGGRAAVLFFNSSQMGDNFILKKIETTDLPSV